jgi:hypothetical protein
MCAVNRAAGVVLAIAVWVWLLCGPSPLKLQTGRVLSSEWDGASHTMQDELRNQLVQHVYSLAIQGCTKYIFYSLLRFISVFFANRFASYLSMCIQLACLIPTLCPASSHKMNRFSRCNFRTFYILLFKWTEVFENTFAYNGECNKRRDRAA